jgi:sugar-specific transcriptional regulator TrmB
MVFKEEYVQLLTRLGFTQTQARLYLTLLEIGRTDAKALSRCSRVPRQAVYRALQELQEMGFVEKVIAIPYEFKPVQICDGLSVLMKQRADEYHKFLKRIDDLLLLLEPKKKVMHEKEPKFIMIQGKERLIQLIRNEHDHAQRSVDIISTQQRWLQILYFCLKNYEKALERGVKYRVIIEEIDNEEDLRKKAQILLAKPNFQLRLIHSSTKCNAAIFDGKEATFNFYLEEPLKDSPIILTDHPTFLSMYKSHFEDLWNKASALKLRLLIKK